MRLRRKRITVGTADESAPAAEEPQKNDTEGTKNETDAQMEIEALPAESPKLYLNTYEVTVEAGNNLDKTSYIKEMTDDADSQESLFKPKLKIDGDVDTAVPGRLHADVSCDGQRWKQIKCSGAYRTRSVRIEELL